MSTPPSLELFDDSAAMTPRTSPLPKVCLPTTMPRSGGTVELPRRDQDALLGEPADGVPAGLVPGRPEVERRLGVVDAEARRLQRVAERVRPVAGAEDAGAVRALHREPSERTAPYRRRCAPEVWNPSDVDTTGNGAKMTGTAWG